MKRNQSQLRTKGLVIRTTDTFEHSRIITVLTDTGKLQAGAGNARKMNSHLFAGAALFCYSDMTFSMRQNAELQRLTSCLLIENFYNIRKEVLSLALASYFCELIYETAYGEDTQQILRLALNSLHALCTGAQSDTDSILLTKPCFEVRLMTLCGFGLNLINCVKCGNNSIYAASLMQGGALCQHCAPCVQDAQALSAACFEALRYVMSCDLKRLHSFKASPAVLKEMADFAEKFALFHVEKAVKPLKFLKSFELNA